MTKWKCFCEVGLSAIAEVLIAEGLDKTLAVERGEDAVLAIEGALILSQGLNDFSSFQRVISRLPQQLCRDLVIGKADFPAV
ncbi:MAG: hypothetical protein WA919_26275 [Coleofasciculaceae cyanobacterium]